MYFTAPTWRRKPRGCIVGPFPQLLTGKLVASITEDRLLLPSLDISKISKWVITGIKNETTDFLTTAENYVMNDKYFVDNNTLSFTLKNIYKVLTNCFYKIRWMVHQDEPPVFREKCSPACYRSSLSSITNRNGSLPYHGRFFWKYLKS